MQVERLNKIRKLLKIRLNWVQNSVFEGELTNSDFKSLKKEISKIVDKEKDSILIYRFKDKQWIDKSIIGLEKSDTDNFI